MSWDKENEAQTARSCGYRLFVPLVKAALSPPPPPPRPVNESGRCLVVSHKRPAFAIKRLRMRGQGVPLGRKKKGTDGREDKVQGRWAGPLSLEPSSEAKGT